VTEKELLASVFFSWKGKKIIMMLGVCCRLGNDGKEV